MIDTGTAVHLPAAKEVRDLIGGLVDKEVSLTPAPPFAVSQYHPASVASYVDHTLTVRATIALDLKLSAFLAAGLALMPPSATSEALDTQRLSPVMAETLQEVFSVMISLFNVGGATHLKLYRTFPAGESLPHDVRARTQVLGRRCDLGVSLAGYGQGRLAVVLS